MDHNKQIPDKHNHPSKLERFELGFEYNKTIQEVKREVRVRTY